MNYFICYPLSEGVFFVEPGSLGLAESLAQY